jgi:hypothetical protein
MSCKKISVYAARKTARRHLRESGLCAKLAALYFLCFFSVCGISLFMYRLYSVLISYIKTVPPMLGYGLACAASILCIVLVVSPFYRGIEHLAMGYVLFGRLHYGAVLAFYTQSVRYRYAVCKGLSRIGRFALYVAVSFAAMRLGRRVAEHLIGEGDTVRGALVLGGTLLFMLLALVIFWFFAASRFLMGAATASAPLLSYRQILALSAVKMRVYRKKVFLYQISFIPLLILSIALLGLPLVFVLPYMRMTKCVLGAEILRQ